MLPDTFRRWHLYGAGLDSLRLDSVPMPEPGPDEILVRHDACGICFSDIKIINLGPRHPRVFGRDMENNPVVMGHEVALTVEKVGANRTDRFRPGQRFIVQADVFYKGNNIAYGYALLGGMAQWGLVGNEVLDGDEGCYLLPLPDHVGVVAAALVEPWACVEAAHRWDESGPLHAVLEGEITDESVAAACVGMPRDGVVRVSADARAAGAVAVDVGRVHYDGWRFVGPKPNTRCELKAYGTVWMVGAGGPMGQMHVQRALALPNPPRRIVVTDRHDHRLDALLERNRPQADARGVELIAVNVRSHAFDAAEHAPDGYDDIVVMVPDINAVEEAWAHLGDDGVLNVFAGVARGTMARLDLARVAQKNIRVVGTSGSKIADMQAVLDKTASGTLDTMASLSAIGGMEAFRDGLEAVQSSRFPGKTIIFPHIEGLPLTPLSELHSVRPDVAQLLRPGGLWSDGAEAMLLGECRR